MNPQSLSEEMQELLSEAAVEIANLDSPDNVVCRRLRAMQNRLQSASTGESLRKFTASETRAGFLASSAAQQTG